MNKKIITGIITLIFTLALVITAGCISSETAAGNDIVKNNGDGTLTVTDSFGRIVTIPAGATDVATAGTSAARYMVYVDAQNVITGVDLSEARPARKTYEPRPFALANRQLMDITVVTTDNNEVLTEILLKENPQLLILGSEEASRMATADDITAKTGIPVVMIDETADLGEKREKFDYNINLLAGIFGKEKRAEELFSYIDTTIADLNDRTKNIPDADKPTVYIGGVSYSGAKPLTFTEPDYPSFGYINVDNVAKGTDKSTTLAVEISKEKLLEWDPEVIFLDASSLRYKAGDNAFTSLSSYELYSGMQAVKENEVYVCVPYVWASINHESALANAYYIGKILFPSLFSDINPEEKADDIYEHFVGKAVFTELNGFLDGNGFTKYNLKA